jgi:endonuclease/exonuclease/phosphatase family metal-dependent hydrolase
MSEVDRFHTRSGDINIALELAKRLKMNYAYGVEFVDFTDKTPATQGTSGNAILTKLPISNTTSLRHTVVFDWSKPAMFSDEPRDGGRMALLADVEIAPGKNIRVVSAHLENRSSAQGRAAQMDEIIKAVENVKTPVAIAGDMNDIGGTLMFDHLAKAGFSNALEKNTENTGGCRIEKDGKLLCLIKLDWILFRGLKLTGARVDGVVDSKGKLISDHKPVWSEFSVAE